MTLLHDFDPFLFCSNLWCDVLLRILIIPKNEGVKTKYIVDSHPNTCADVFPQQDSEDEVALLLPRLSCLLCNALTTLFAWVDKQVFLGIFQFVSPHKEIFNKYTVPPSKRGLPFWSLWGQGVPYYICIYVYTCIFRFLIVYIFIFILIYIYIIYTYSFRPQ